MSLWGQFAIIAALFVVVFVLHRRARRANFERFRAYHSRRKYRLVAAPNEAPEGGPDAPDEAPPPRED